MSSSGDNNLFGVQCQCLRLLGHRLLAQHATTRSVELLKHLGWLFLVLSAQAPMINFVMYHRDNLTLVTGALSIMLTNLLTVCKMATFLWHKAGFVELMQHLDNMYSTIRSLEARHQLCKSHVAAQRLVRLYLYSGAATGIYFLVAPFFKYLYAQLVQSPYTWTLPMPMRFPFDFESTPGYELCYAYTIFVTGAVVLYVASLDGLFMSFAFILRAHFRVLETFIESHSFSGDCASNLHGYVDYHALLLDHTHHLCRIYKPIILGQFLVSSLELCLIMYHVMTHMDNVSVIIIYMTFLVTIMLQLLIYCYGGEILRAESVQVGMAVQMSTWYNLPPSHRRTLALILLRSQREASIKAGFNELSLASFMTILKAAMSYVTLIQSIE